MTADPLLLVADHIAGAVHVLRLPDGTVVDRLYHRHLSEHAGFLSLPGGRTAVVDDRAGELLVLDPFGAAQGRALVESAIPVAVPAEHLAADPSGRKLAVTTGLGDNAAPWTDLLTVVDLDTRRTARVRTRVGEPGVTVLGDTGSPGGSGDEGGAVHDGIEGDRGPLVVLRQREPGGLAGYRHAELLAAAPGCPQVTPHTTLPLPDDGHGDAHDPATGRVFAATGTGVHRARREGDRLVPEEPLAWHSAGRGYYLRLDPVRRLLWSCLRGGPTDPGRWAEWTNEAWCHALDPGRTEVVDLGPGLVFRMGIARRHAAYARVHPDGDELILLSCGTSTDEFADEKVRIPLPPMDGAPRRDGTPWEGVQRRAIAASSGSSWVAVSRGGHGEVHLFDADAGSQEAVLPVDTPLDHGGQLALLTPDDPAHGDPVGR